MPDQLRTRLPGLAKSTFRYRRASQHPSPLRPYFFTPETQVPSSRFTRAVALKKAPSLLHGIHANQPASRKAIHYDLQKTRPHTDITLSSLKHGDSNQSCWDRETAFHPTCQTPRGASTAPAAGRGYLPARLWWCRRSCRRHIADLAPSVNCQVGRIICQFCGISRSLLPSVILSRCYKFA
jgi:hypothetical protein